MRYAFILLSFIALPSFAQAQGELFVSGGPSVPFYYERRSHYPGDGALYGSSTGYRLSAAYLLPADTGNTTTRILLGLDYVSHNLKVYIASESPSGNGAQHLDLTYGMLDIRLMPQWSLFRKRRFTAGFGVILGFPLWARNHGVFGDTDVRGLQSPQLSAALNASYYAPLSGRCDVGISVLGTWSLLNVIAGAAWVRSVEVGGLVGVRYGLVR